VTADNIADRPSRPAGHIPLAALERTAGTAWDAAGHDHYQAGAYADAAKAWERCSQIDDTDPELHHNIGRARYQLGDIGGAARGLRRAASLTDSVDPWVALATLIPADPDATPSDILETRRETARRLARSSPARAVDPPRRQSHDSGRLKVGYLSAHLDDARYMKPVWGVINRHDRGQFEIFLLDDSPPGGGRPGYREHPRDRVEPVSAMDNAELAALIRDLGIQVLVDLSCYSAIERLPLFLSPPAPVTMAWFNMYATSGLPGIGHIVGDHVVARNQDEVYHSERVHRVEGSYIAFEVLHEVPDPAPPPSLSHGHITFGSLATQYKITPNVLDTWSAILRRIDTARLVVGNAALGNDGNRRYLLRRLSDRAVDPERVTLLGPADHLGFLRYYDMIDVALDSFPYNGGTTTTEALWQGVPVLTFEGDRWVSRTSASLLRAGGLDRWVSPDRHAMVDTAAELARDPATPGMLEGLRSGMRRRLGRSSACDCTGLTRRLETLYREMW
jgi:protein O-GlcNAc transferase